MRLRIWNRDISLYVYLLFYLLSCHPRLHLANDALANRLNMALSADFGRVERHHYSYLFSLHVCDIYREVCVS